MFGSLLLVFFSLGAFVEDDTAYIKANAVPIITTEHLSDSVYTLLSPYQVIMFGEMHGTNESAPFVSGLADLFTRKGDSVSVGFEIPPENMELFSLSHTDSSVYKSNFFLHPPYASGKESNAWAVAIASLSRNPKVSIFFFDINVGEKTYQRDSLMAGKIKRQILLHPKHRVITLSGNYHNRVTDATSMTGYLMRDKELNAASKICSLNMEYQDGAARANFGHGLEVKRLGRPENAFDTSVPFEQYLLLMQRGSTYEYTGFYYTKHITPATMVNQQ